MLKENRLTVQFARGSRPRDTFAAQDRTHPRPRRTAFRMQLTGLAEGTSWQVSYTTPSLLWLSGFQPILVLESAISVTTVWILYHHAL